MLWYHRVYKSVAPKCFLWKTKTKFLTQLFCKTSVLCDAHPIYLIYIYSQGPAVSVCIMSDRSDSQNKSEEQVQMSEGTSPSSTSDEGRRSTPSNLAKAATRARKKKTSDSEDEYYVAVEDCRISGSGRPLWFEHWDAHGDLSPTDLRPISSCHLS